ncbi:hypothetical protein HPB51_002999 [Rhipicephalus microplus]|uniref:DDE Tnp4 domain-containing protein n=1 Tax=Rhipicephalus microplus TaxID=6941 RepID=A0A9J6DSI6_RHIMP|nr:hypothetical protein HPB51_002999 [Rhipicephalus microplus]
MQVFNRSSFQHLKRHLKEKKRTANFITFVEAHSRRIFNYRLSRAHRVIESAFGIMAQRWRILRRPFKAKDDNIQRNISACVVLHNFMMKKSEASRCTYHSPGTADQVDCQGNITESNWRADGTSSAALPSLLKTGCHATRQRYFHVVRFSVGLKLFAYEMRDLLALHHQRKGALAREQGVTPNEDSGCSSGSSKDDCDLALVVDLALLCVATAAVTCRRRTPLT